MSRDVAADRGDGRYPLRVAAKRQKCYASTSFDRLGARIGQRHRARADVVVLLLIDAQSAVDGGEQLGGADLALGDAVALGVGLAVDRAALDAAAGQRRAPGRGEMVAAQAGVDAPACGRTRPA